MAEKAFDVRRIYLGGRFPRQKTLKSMQPLQVRFLGPKRAVPETQGLAHLRGRLLPGFGGGRERR